MRYRKKPVIVEAFKLSVFSTSDTLALPYWVVPSIRAGLITPHPDGGAIIKTLEGDMRANPDDWIIKGVNDELYPCKPDIFDRTYELVSDAE